MAMSFDGLGTQISRGGEQTNKGALCPPPPIWSTCAIKHNFGAHKSILRFATPYINRVC